MGMSKDLASASKVEYLQVTINNGAGQRIDNYLVNKLKNVPKSKIYSILRRGEVRVNKGRIKPSYKLQEDDIVRVPPISNVNANPDQPKVSANQAANFELEVLFEDKNLLIVNKPAGLAVHGGSGLKFGLIELLRARLSDEEHLSLVHRIDRDTSGCVVLAKNLVMLRAMHELLRDHKIEKTYHLLVKGYAAGNFTANEPLKKFVLASGERLVKVHPTEGQESLTKFTLIERYPGASLLQAMPITGRTHQIRVHSANRGLPIIGDDKYGHKDTNQAMRKQGLKRLFLHARQLVFTCPLTGQDLAVQAPYDQDWITGINNLTRNVKND